MGEVSRLEIADALLDAHLRVARLGTSTRNTVLRILGLLEEDLAGAIAATDPSAPALLRARQLLLQQVLREDLRPLVQARYGQVAQETASVASAMAVFEAQQTAELLAAVVDIDTQRQAAVLAALPVQLEQTLLPSVATSQELSATASTWWVRQAANLEQRVFDQLNVGIVQGEDVSQLLRRLRGTRARGYTDGVMEVSRRDAVRLIRTQFNSVANTAQLAVYDAHAESLEATEHLSTLDGRTGLVCIARSGLRYTLPDHEPIGHEIPFLGGPPYHWNALARGTSILTDVGGLPIEEVQVGMHVMTHCGRLRRVIETMRKSCESGVIRRIETDTRRILLATEEHPILGVPFRWRRADTLNPGDQCLEYDKEPMERHTTIVPSLSPHLMSQQGPSLCDNRGVSGKIASFLCWDCVVSPVNLYPNALGWKRKVYRINADGILEDYALDVCVGEGIQDVFFNGAGVGSPGLCARFHHSTHRGILLRGVRRTHTLAACFVVMMGLLGVSVRPMLLAAWPRGESLGSGTPSLKAADFISDSNPMFFAPETQTTCGNPMLALQRTERESLVPMFSLNKLSYECFISEGYHSDAPLFEASTIISNVEVPYDGDVYNIAVEEDESYIANGIVVHNCRSVMIPVVPGMGASVDETFAQFLDRRGAAFQDALLGPARARLYRSGGLGSLTMLLDAATGRPLTLQELGL